MDSLISFNDPIGTIYIKSYEWKERPNQDLIWVKISPTLVKCTIYGDTNKQIIATWDLNYRFQEMQNLGIYKLEKPSRCILKFLGSISLIAKQDPCFICGREI